jgi:hypothetical protein
MRQDHELQDLMKKRKRLIITAKSTILQPSTARALVVQPVHNDSNSVNIEKGDMDTMSYSSDVQVTGVKAPSGVNIV